MHIRANHQHPWTRPPCTTSLKPQPPNARSWIARLGGEERKTRRGTLHPSSGIHTRDTISSGRRRWRCGRGSFTGIVARHPSCTFHLQQPPSLQCNTLPQPLPRWRAAPVVLRPAGGLPVQEENENLLNLSFVKIRRSWLIEDSIVCWYWWSGFRECSINSGSLLVFVDDLLMDRNFLIKIFLPFSFYDLRD